VDDYEVNIIGGGAAGLTAALILGRAGRRVLVCDAGEPRNARSKSAHGLFTRDGAPPFELLRIAREQLAPYRTVRIEATVVERLVKTNEAFETTMRDGTGARSRKILLATGIVDELPPTPGFSELWGLSVLHCPYCHGWEIRDQPVACYGSGQEAFDFCVLLTGWHSDIVLCSDGPANLTDEQRRLLSKNGIQVSEKAIARLEASGETLEKIVFTDNETLERKALYLSPKQRVRLELLESLGCERMSDGYLRIDEAGQTTVRGLYLAGDVSRTGAHDLSLAVLSGSRAGSAINRALLRENFGLR